MHIYVHISYSKDVRHHSMCDEMASPNLEVLLPLLQRCREALLNQVKISPGEGGRFFPALL